jgi:hypothetical protein
VTGLAELLFGPAPGEAETRRLWGLRYATVAFILALIIVGRRPDVLTNPQFWAEDGSIFFQENLTIGFLPAFLKLYRGYPNLAQRLVALAGGWVPFACTPRVYTTGAIAVTALTLASFCLPAFRHIVRSEGLRVGFCVACVCVPGGVESFATPTNIGWFLAVWLVFLSLMRLPASTWRVAPLAAGGTIAVFSTPLAVLMSPLWVLRLAAGIMRRGRHDVAFAATLLVAMCLVLVMTHTLGAETNLVLALPGYGKVAVGFRWISVWNGIGYTFGAVFLPPVVLSAVAPDHSWLLPVGALVIAGAAVGMAAAEGDRRLAAVLVCLYAIAGAVGLMLVGRPVMNAVLGTVMPSLYPGRYLVFPAALLVLLAVIVVDGLSPRRMRLGAAALWAIVGCAWGPSFALPPLADLQWPVWAARLEAKVASGSDTRLTIPVNGAQQIELGEIRRRD